MANVDFEAWLDRTAPIIIGTPIYQDTVTQIDFIVLDIDRVAKNLTDFAFKFSAKAVDGGGTALFDVVCTATILANGTIKASLSVANLATAAECLGELRLFSGGNNTGDVTDRIQFRFDIVKGVV